MSAVDHDSNLESIDRAIVDLLNQRARLQRELRARRVQSAQPAYLPSEETIAIENAVRANRGPLDADAVRAVYRQVLASTRALDRPLRVGFLGPAATFTYEAARKHFGSAEEFVPYRTFSEVFLEVQKRTVDFGVVAIENSTEGIVRETVDRFLDTDLQISAEIDLPVSQFLLSNGELSQIRQVFSHPQALAQCRRWLSEHLPNAALTEVASTALAAQLARDPETGAISTESASEVFDLPIRASRIEDAAANVTRFFVIGPTMSPRSGHDRSALVFGVQDKAGALFQALKAFSDNGINLSQIESRPSRRRNWEYVFFASLDGHPTDDHVASALATLSQVCGFVRVLGAWPI